MITQVAAALSGHLAAGGVLLTALLSLAHPLPPAFLRFCTSSAAGLAILAALGNASDSGARWVWAGLGATAALWHLVVRKNGTSSKAVSGLAALVALTALALVASLGSPDRRWLAISGSLSSALLLGAVTVTMILGHWYLVDTQLSIAPLRDGARWVSLAVVARWAVVLTALLLGGWEMLRVSRAADLIFSTNGLFFLFRSLMGLGAPLVLAGLIWQTVKIRSTQSATGLLYVALILVLFGELVSHFLRLATGHPL